MSIHDDAWHGRLTADNLKKYLAGDPSIINRAGGTKKITPLAAACWRGHLEVVKVLLAEGANPNALSPTSRTPLFFVTTQSPPANRFAILRALIDARVDINLPCDKDGNTPLMNALSQTKDPKIVRELVDRKAKQSHKNVKGETAETLAEKHRMKRHMRSKAERNSTKSQIVDVAVSLVLLVASYTNKNTVTSVLGGVVKRFYNLTGKSTPKLEKEIPITKDVGKFKTNLDNYVENSNLKKFFAPSDPFIQKLAVKAHAIHEDPTTDLGKPENLRHLIRLSLYHPIIFCDDSTSMADDDRYQNQLLLVDRIARVATKIVPDDLAGVDLRFINHNGSGLDRLDADALEKAIKAVKPKGGTPIATSLRSKILEPLVYNAISAGEFKRPIFVCIITDGSPSGEPYDLFAKTILECKQELVRGKFHPASVSFLVSQIGSDEFAADFLESLRTDPRLNYYDSDRVGLHCTADRLDDKFQELQENERVLESWLLRVLTRPIMERHEE